MLSEPIEKTVRFRPTRKYWRDRLIETTVIFIFGVASLTILSKVGALDNFLVKFFVLFCLGGSVIALLFLLWIRTHAELVLDQTYIKGNTGLTSFEIIWDEIIAISNVISNDRHKTQALLLFTQEDEVIMELKGFDETAIWQAIQTYAAPSTLEPDAYKQLSQYKNYKQQLQEQLPLNIMASPDSRLVYIGCSLFLLFATYMLFQISPIMSVICAFVFLLVIFETLLLFSKLTIDNETITSWKLWKRYEIAWADVDLAEIYGSGHSIAFHYKQNKLIIPTRMWRSKQKEDFDFLFSQQIEARQIEVKNSRKLIYPQI